jgi:23S rRNA (cytosine1962-C5)-methyltransferase
MAAVIRVRDIRVSFAVPFSRERLVCNAPRRRESAIIRGLWFSVRPWRRWEDSLRDLVLERDTIGPVARGHPWVYKDGARGTAPLGELVRLVDQRGRTVAYGLADVGDIVVRVLGRHPQSMGELIPQRVQVAQAWRDAAVPPRTDAYRVINGAGDGLPGVVLDRYAELGVVRLYSEAWLPWLPQLVEAIRRLPWVRGVVRRLGVQRVDGGSGIELLHGPEPAETLVVQEHGLRFLVRPRHGQKTGLFLDQRDNRHRVAGWARGREVVNLFGYNGGFSVHAAAAGSGRTVTVDQAPDALEDARENFRLNGLDPDAHGFEQADAFRWRPPRQVGLVINDPPSLSHGARSDGAARTAYRDLNAHAAGMVARGGLLVSASCTARLREDRWLEAVRSGVGRAGGPWVQVFQAREPVDHPVAVGHPEGHYLKLVAMLKAGAPRRTVRPADGEGCTLGADPMGPDGSRA